jgi:hypothetical protein
LFFVHTPKNVNKQKRKTVISTFSQQLYTSALLCGFVASSRASDMVLEHFLSAGMANGCCWRDYFSFCSWLGCLLLQSVELLLQQI